MRNLGLPSLLHPVWTVRKQRQEGTWCNFFPLATAVWSLSSLHIRRRDRDAGEPRIISGQLLPLQEKGWREPVLRDGWETVRRALKHELMWGTQHGVTGDDDMSNRCFTCRLSMQPQNWLEVRSEASVSSKSWKRGKQRQLYSKSTLLWVIKGCSAPFCLAQPHGSLKSAEWNFICPGKDFLRAFQGLTTLAVKSGWSVFYWTQALCLAVNLWTGSHAFQPWSAKNNSELAQSCNFKSVVGHKHVSLFYRDCLGRTLCFLYCLCKNNSWVLYGPFDTKMIFNMDF